jgi:hypothetical protein
MPLSTALTQGSSAVIDVVAADDSDDVDVEVSGEADDPASS